MPHFSPLNILQTFTILSCLLFIVQPAEAFDSDKESKESYQVLSTHETQAVFKGTSERKCRHMTALCPDRCNHGGTVAEFTITRYLRYDKPGKYGDPKTKLFTTMLKKPDMDQKTIERIGKLAPGTALTLNWEHRYISRTYSDGTSAKFPRRVITKLETSPLALPAK
ncbi:hypothetical protein HW115_12175 [Verrucomicrobiaceae bacterium N1E253]|uniref:Uncharacterized protein n=1 Tax=Oceaniferula marina TaxID=2748318 RepID=A0A851GKL1_9BACT|nr:hypothetical protein [Oceaniferula marina]NWK56371.1 hypothetical protein [Oceaniferula marina]